MPRPDVIDLRTDVKTLPSREMLETILEAPLGDSKMDEDPTVLRLEAMAAERLGAEAALLVISGTMANAAAMVAHAPAGEAFIVDPDAHIYRYEECHASIAGLMPVLTPARDGLMDPDGLLETLRSGPRAKLLWLENTHNRGGGRAVPLDLYARLAEIAHEHDLPVHVDGARIFNAAVATGTPAAEYGRRVDSITFCLSKSLGCPLGSVLCGGEAVVRKARVAMRRLGGGMRQAGVIAACGIYALENMIDRLAEDHANARRLAQGVNDLPGLTVDLDIVDTNMLKPLIDPTLHAATEWTKAFKDEGVLTARYGPDTLRMVTHLHHTPQIIDEALRRMRTAAEKMG